MPSPTLDAERPGRAALARLEHRIARILGASSASTHDGARVVSTGWSALDAGIAGVGGLVTGAVHEWLGVADARDRARGEARQWTPPLHLFAHLAQQALDAALEHAPDARVAWIGRRVWPYPRALVRDRIVRERDGNRGARPLARTSTDVELARLAEPPLDPMRLFARSILIDTETPAERSWALDQALRSAAVCAVVADGSRLDLAATRRLQLAAEAGCGVGLIARPISEARQPSAAATRWRVTRVPPGERDEGPAWRVELVRNKRVLRAEASGGTRETMELGATKGPVTRGESEDPCDASSR